MALAHGAVGWSAVCDCDIPLLYSLIQHVTDCLITSFCARNYYKIENRYQLLIVMLCVLFAVIHVSFINSVKIQKLMIFSFSKIEIESFRLNLCHYTMNKAEICKRCSKYAIVIFN